MSGGAASDDGEREADNLKLVVDVLATAGIEFFFVPIAHSGRYRIGLSGDGRSQVWNAFLTSALPPETLVCDVQESTRRLDPAGAPGFASGVQRVMHSDVWVVWRPVTDATGSIVLGARYGCEIEFWTRGRLEKEGSVDDGTRG